MNTKAFSSLIAAIDGGKLKKVPTDSLRFIHGVGQEGLRTWAMSAKQRQQVTTAINKLGEELQRRGA